MDGVTMTVQWLKILIFYYRNNIWRYKMAKKKVNKSEQRKDHKKRVLYRGEFQRDDGLYMYSYTDPITKKRNCVYKMPTMIR